MPHLRTPIEMDYTEIDSLGEFGLIERISAAMPLQRAGTIKGIGDDCAVLEPSGECTLISTDMMVETVHFDFHYTPPMHLGYKAITSTISDIYAMNGRPEGITVAMALSARFAVEIVDELFAGMRLACDHYGVDLIGGDTTTSRSGLVLSMTAIGKAREADIVYRNGAKPHDIICVSGDIGGAYAGLRVLERENKATQGLGAVPAELTGFEYALRRQLRPEARKEVIEYLAEIGIKPTAMMDISDGLSSDLLHLCKASSLGCGIYEDKLPIDARIRENALSLGLVPTVCALNGGEDYELLFTLSAADYQKLEKEGSEGITAIGYMAPLDEGKLLVSKGGASHPLTAQGWRSF